MSTARPPRWAAKMAAAFLVFVMLFGGIGVAVWWFLRGVGA